MKINIISTFFGDGIFLRVAQVSESDRESEQFQSWSLPMW